MTDNHIPNEIEKQTAWRKLAGEPETLFFIAAKVWENREDLLGRSAKLPRVRRAIMQEVQEARKPGGMGFPVFASSEDDGKIRVLAGYLQDYANSNAKPVERDFYDGKLMGRFNTLKDLGIDTRSIPHIQAATILGDVAYQDAQTGQPASSRSRR